MMRRIGSQGFGFRAATNPERALYFRFHFSLRLSLSSILRTCTISAYFNGVWCAVRFGALVRLNHSDARTMYSASVLHWAVASASLSNSLKVICSMRSMMADALNRIIIFRAPAL
jgi:hypothetical protein